MANASSGVIFVDETEIGISLAAAAAASKLSGVAIGIAIPSFFRKVRRCSIDVMLGLVV